MYQPASAFADARHPKARIAWPGGKMTVPDKDGKRKRFIARIIEQAERPLARPLSLEQRRMARQEGMKPPRSYRVQWAPTLSSITEFEVGEAEHSFKVSSLEGINVNVKNAKRQRLQSAAAHSLAHARDLQWQVRCARAQAPPPPRSGALR